MIDGTVRDGRGTAATAAAGIPWGLSVSLVLGRDGPELTRETVTDDDMVDVKSEFWREELLRKGRTDLALEDLELRLEPIPSESGQTCAGYTVETVTEDGKALRRSFSIYSLEHVASRAAQRLVAQGVMRIEDLYFYRLHAERRTDSSPSSGARGEDVSFTTEAKVRRVEPLSLPIAPLLERARWIGPKEGDGCRVFYTEEALARAERLARKGASKQPPVETGAVLVGPVCACPLSGDLFVVVADVIELAEAEQGQFSLSYSSATWARIETVMRAIRSRPATQAWGIVGQCHGHNFVPGNGAPPCDECASLPVCGRTSVFVSLDDLNWSRAVFRGQPWHLCQIFGFNARKENLQGLFGLRDGRLLERGFHVIPEFNAGTTAGTTREPKG